MLWQVEGFIPIMDTRVRGPGPCFASRCRGVRRIVIKVVAVYERSLRTGARELHKYVDSDKIPVILQLESEFDS